MFKARCSSRSSTLGELNSATNGLRAGGVAGRPRLARGISVVSSFGGNRSRKPDRKAKQPGLFEVKIVTPPPRSLGIFALPPNTHNGEQIEIDGQGYVVTALELQYKLIKGKYVRNHNKLEVQPTGRYFLNMTLENLVAAKYIGPTGPQD